MIVQNLAYPRSGLLGNPSDIFGGKVISLLFDAFSTQVTLYESPQISIIPNSRDSRNFEDIEGLVEYRTRFGYYGGVRLIEALIVRFHHYCQEKEIKLPKANFTIQYKSDIPFGLGLGGSSAIIAAVFRALMEFFSLTEKDIPLPEQPNIILEAETKELGITAGPQDRVIAVYGGVVAMDFSKKTYERNNGLHGDYSRLKEDNLPSLYIAYNENLSKSSGKIHNIMRYRVNKEQDNLIAEVMKEKANLVDKAINLIESGKGKEIGPLMDQDFNLRASVYNLPNPQINMIMIARKNGSHAKFSGSGGAVIGTYQDENHLTSLVTAFQLEGLSILPVKIANHGSKRKFN